MLYVFFFFIPLCRATVVLNYATYWVEITSTPVQVKGNGNGFPAAGGSPSSGRADNVMTNNNTFPRHENT